MWDARFSLLTVALAGFGRDIAELGAGIIVGGNIDRLTRVMTTAIALGTSKGNLAIALGIVLLALSEAGPCLTRAPCRQPPLPPRPPPGPTCCRGGLWGLV